MGKPKKQTSARKTGLRRSHLVLKLARMVNGKSPVKVFTTKRESGKSRLALKQTIATPKKETKEAAPASK
ncbi:MAG TPA: hypothetical protein VD907_02075 [Verrucomicrobiae bacterium]|nr:hypothetical protein [Verrucomicrobiae bacterium]